MIGLCPVVFRAQTLELDNDTLHLKLDLSRGGAINYISVSGSNRNIVNIHDEGRYIQQSYYAGEVLNRQAVGQNPSWSPWAWNPIQVGDSYNNRAEILEQWVDGNTAYTRCIPMLWDMNNEPAEAEMEQWTTLMGNVVKVHNRITCMRTDDIWGEGQSRHQELPAVYPISALSELYSYFGNFPFEGAPLSNPEVVNLSSGFWGRYQDGRVKESWMAFVDHSGWGMAVYSPSTTDFLAGMAGQPMGEAMDGSTSYIAPVKHAKFYKNTVYEYDYWLLIGSLDQIRRGVYQLKGVQQNHWEFEEGLEGWKGRGVTPGEGSMLMDLSDSPAGASLEPPGWNPDSLSHVWISLKNNTPADSGAFRVFSESGDSATVHFAMDPEAVDRQEVFLKMDTLDIWEAGSLMDKIVLGFGQTADPATLAVDFIRFVPAMFRIRSEGNAREITGFGNTLQIYAETLPEYSPAQVEWSVDHGKLASVDAGGKLTAHSRGIVTVTARAKDGSGEALSLRIEIIDDGQTTSWEFIDDVGGWDKNAHSCTVAHSGESLKVSVEGGDPYVSNIVDPWPVGELRYLWMSVKNETAGSGGALYFFPSAGGHDFVPFPLTPDDTEHRDVFVDMQAAEKWTKDQVIGTLRLDANNGGETGDIYFDFIRFREELLEISSSTGTFLLEEVGGMLELSAEVLVDVDLDPVFKWSTGDTDVISVDSAGMLTALAEGEALARVVDVNGSGLSGDVLITVQSDHTGTGRTRREEVHIYPNPVEDMLYIESADYRALGILDLTGALLMHIPEGASTEGIHLGCLASGMYILRLDSGKGSVRHVRFIKE